MDQIGLGSIRSQMFQDRDQFWSFNRRVIVRSVDQIGFNYGGQIVQLLIVGWPEGAAASYEPQTPNLCAGRRHNRPATLLIGCRQYCRNTGHGRGTSCAGIFHRHLLGPEHELSGQIHPGRVSAKVMPNPRWQCATPCSPSQRACWCSCFEFIFVSRTARWSATDLS